MIRFNSDYTEGALPEILDALVKTNFEQTTGYGEDEYCAEAREYIKSACNAPSSDVHFLVGGTQTNLTVISSLLRPYQAVLCADSGHINTHETGAIEATGHKVMTVQGNLGKICADDVYKAYRAHFEDESREHITQPKVVYISHPTEWGTLYSKRELEEISEACKKCNFYLYLDGARLGYGLVAEGTDVTLPDLARLCDCFYIGGTKCGALFGEAVVITNDEIKADFRYCIKQKGALLAKGRLLGIQFCELFKDGLYERACKNANVLALRIRNAFAECGFEFYFDSVTNQQFPIFTKEEIDTLSAKYGFLPIEKLDESRTAVRFCTSWATRDEDVDALIRDIKMLK
ncbi:MAG: low specificity L-threonine aldolase [Clostridia bacterium]|nr:low specificity L-threonine aldolase [Clostridia bacterium]